MMYIHLLLFSSAKSSLSAARRTYKIKMDDTLCRLLHMTRSIVSDLLMQSSLADSVSNVKTAARSVAVLS